MSKLVELLTQLGTNAALADAYAKDPEGIMTLAGLSDEEKALMRNGDIQKIKEATGLENVTSINTSITAYK